MGGSLGSGFNLGSDLKKLESKAKNILEGRKRNVFISFSYEDIDKVILLRGQAQNEQSNLEFSDRSVKEAFNSENAEYIKRKITEKINQASVTVVYISENTSNSQWVKWEVEKSLQKGKGVVAVYQGDIKPTMPAFIIENGIKSVKWSHKELADAIENASQRYCKNNCVNPKIKISGKISDI